MLVPCKTYGGDIIPIFIIANRKELKMGKHILFGVGLAVFLASLAFGAGAKESVS